MTRYMYMYLPIKVTIDTGGVHRLAHILSMQHQYGCTHEHIESVVCIQSCLSSSNLPTYTTIT